MISPVLALPRCLTELLRENMPELRGARHTRRSWERMERFQGGVALLHAVRRPTMQPLCRGGAGACVHEYCGGSLVAEFGFFDYLLPHAVSCSPLGNEPAMYPLQFSLVFHILGIGMIFTTLIGGWIVDRRYRKATGWETKALVLGILRPIGLLSPIGVVIMLLSGIANMHFLGLGIFTAAWLTLKLVFFALMVISGIAFAVRGARRAKVVAQFVAGGQPADAGRTLANLDRQQQLFYLVQTVLLLIIISLSLFKPTS